MNFNRRKVLASLIGSGVSLSDLSRGDSYLLKLLNGLLDQCVQTAHASGTIHDLPRYFLNIVLQGGARSSMSFKCLNPSGATYPDINPNYVHDTTIDNITLNSDNLPTYHTSYPVFPFGNHGGHAPKLWSYQVPNGTGNTSPLTSLLSNSIFINYSNLNPNRDDHDINLFRTANPTGEQSIHGVYDQFLTTLGNLPGRAIMSTLAVGKLWAYKTTGTASPLIISTPTSNYGQRLLEAFNLIHHNNQPAHFSQAAREVKINEFLNEYKNTKNQTLFNAHDTAIALFKSNVGTLIDYYNQRQNVYYQISLEAIRGARNANHDGFFDRPYPGLPNLFRVPGNKDLRGNIGAADARTSFLSYNDSIKAVVNSDLRDCFNSATLREPLHKMFALAETALWGIQVPGEIHRIPISSSLSLNIDGGLDNIIMQKGNFTKSYDAGSDTTTFQLSHVESVTVSYGFDDHGHGFGITSMVLNLFFLALNTCLLELKRRLSLGQTITGETVDDKLLIAVFSELFRKMKYNDSEHFGEGCAVHLIDNRFDFAIFGDIFKNSNVPNDIWFGTQGHAAPMRALSNGSVLQNKSLTITTVLNTICDLIQIPRIAINEDPFLAVNGNSITPLIHYSTIRPTQVNHQYGGPDT